MTNQEFFDKASVGMLRQMRRSIDSGVCLYRGPGGLRCGVGHAIPDAEYTDKLEGIRVTQLIARAIVTSLSGVDPDLASEVQSVHDVDGVGYWRSALTAVAAVYGLSTAAMDAVNMKGKPIDIETRKQIKIALMRGERVNDLARRYKVSNASVVDIAKMPAAILYADEAPGPRVACGGHQRRKLSVLSDTGARFDCAKLSARNMLVSSCAKRWYQASRLLYEPYVSCRGCELGEANAEAVGLAGKRERRGKSVHYAICGGSQ